MTTPAVEKEVFIEFDKEFYKDRVGSLINPSVARFQKILKSYTLFNLFFILLITAEIIYFFVYH